MGGGGENGVTVDIKASPRRAAIEKTQAELRQEYDVREERRRELEFLEKGGNPLDFKFGPVAAVSLQSTSLTDQPAENYLTSEAKGSFAVVASPNGDSAESSGRPGTCVGREPHTADNLLFFDGENDVLMSERNGVRSTKRGKLPVTEQYSQTGSGRDAKETDDLLVVRLGMKRQAYARRNRSRSSRDIARASSADLVNCAANGNSALAANQDLKDGKSPKGELLKDKDNNAGSVSNPKPSSRNINGFAENPAPSGRLGMAVEKIQNQEVSVLPANVSPEEITSILDSEKSPEQEIFHDSQEAFPEKEPDAMGSTASFSIGEGKEGSFPQLVDANTTSSVGKAGDVISCEGPAVSLMDEDGRENKEKNSTNLMMDTEKSSAIEGDVGSNSVVEKPPTVLESPVVPIHSDSHKECPKHDQADLSEKNIHSVQEDCMDIDVQLKVEEEVCDSGIGVQSSEKPVNDEDAGKADGLPAKDVETVNSQPNDSSILRKESLNSEVPPCTSVPSSCPPPEDTTIEECSGADLVLDDGTKKKELEGNMHQTVVSQEVRPIKAVLKESRGLSNDYNFLVGRRKSHWDFVLEEMAWLANDFMQERIWKIYAAAQVCRWVASRDSTVKQLRKLARSMVVAVMDFWQSAKAAVRDEKSLSTLCEQSDASISGSCNNGFSLTNEGCTEGEKLAQEQSKHPDANYLNRKSRLPVFGYAVRFLKYDLQNGPTCQAEASATPDSMDMGTIESPLEDQLSEVKLFYTVPPFAMGAYRKSVESLWLSNEKQDAAVHREGCDPFSLVDPATAQGTAYEEDDCETGSRYFTGAFEGRKPSKFTSKKRKNFSKSHFSRLHEAKPVPGMAFGNCMDGRFETQAPVTAKRDSSSLNVGPIPTKRVRTAARQRVVSPSAGAVGGMHMVNKNDVSSGDTSSFQDELSSLQVSSQPKKSIEVESTGEFVKQLPLENMEVSTKSKKKKTKPMGYRTFLSSAEPAGFSGLGKSSEYEQRWQSDQVIQNEQKDQVKKRVEGLYSEANGNPNLHGQHAAKRPKISKQLTDTSPEAATPLTGSMSSPAASQMSNIANPNKLMRMIANRDRGRKNKVLKISAGQSGDGMPWTLFEDQALVVLVHDMGPNWELVSDAINSTLQFKCIFRKPKECKERHKALMDKNNGDGADSAEDSGSSQPYPSTLPGIPKGSARQLFKRLQEPMEDDILKDHFQRIITIGQKQHSYKAKSDNQEQKQRTPTHSSHAVALSQACTTTMNGAPMTPLDFCDATTSSSDTVSPGYHASHSTGLALSSHQGPVTPMQSTHMLQGPGGVVLGNTVTSPLGPLSQTGRDVQRYAVPKPLGLPMEEHHRIQQFNQMISNRNIQQSGLAVTQGLQAGGERVRMMPGGNGVGIMPGVSRGMPMPRPGYQGMGSPGMLGVVSSGTSSMLASGNMGVPNPVNMYSGVVSTHGNSVSRSRESLQMMRPAQPSEDQRQMLMQELQLQVSQGSGQGMASFNGLSTPFSNQMVSSPVQAFPVQHPQAHQAPQQSHGINSGHHSQMQNPGGTPQQQAYMYRLSKDRSYQQRFLQQQQQQQQHHHQHFAPNMSLPHAQPQHPVASLQNGPTQQHHQQQQQQLQQQQQQQQQQHPLHVNPQSAAGQAIAVPPGIQQTVNSASLPMNSVPLQGTQKQHMVLPHATSGPNPQAGGLGTPNQVKQRQRQQLQPQHRQQGQGQQPRQQSQAQQAKLSKGLGRGNAVVPSSSVDGSYPSGGATGNQVADKGDQLMHMMHGQRLMPGATSNQGHAGKQMMLSGTAGYQGQANMHLSQTSAAQSQHQKLYPRAVPTSRQTSLSSLPEGTNSPTQGHASGPHNHGLSSSQHMGVGSQQPTNSASVPVSANSPPVSSPLQQQQQPQQQQQKQQQPQQQQMHQQEQQHQQRPLIHTQQPIQRRLQNRQIASETVTQPVDRSASQTVNNQYDTGPSTVSSSCTDSAPPALAGSSVSIPPTQWMPEQSYESSTPTSTAHMATMNTPPQASSMGTEMLPPSGSSALPQRQYSGGVTIHGHNAGGQWQQQPQQSPPPPPQQVRATAQGAAQQHPGSLGLYGSLPSTGPP